MQIVIIMPFLKAAFQPLLFGKIITMKNFISLLLVLFLISAGCNHQNKNKMTDSKQEKPDFKKGYAPVNGLKMYYEIHGKGKPLVLIHGGGSSIYVTFGRILPELAKYYQVIGVDLQAHGLTNDRGTPSSFTQDADDVFALLQYLKVPKAHIFGFSNGGQTAMQLAIRHPESVDKLIIASSFYKKSGCVPGFFEGLAKADISVMPQPLKDEYMKLNHDEEGLQLMFKRDHDRMLAFKDWSDNDLKSIKAKTLYITGNNDVVTPQHVLDMAALTPDAETVILRGYHGEFLGEILAAEQGSRMPEMSVELFKEFLDGK